jgi:hypothetical protein
MRYIRTLGRLGPLPLNTSPEDLVLTRGAHQPDHQSGSFSTPGPAVADRAVIASLMVASFLFTIRYTDS